MTAPQTIMDSVLDVAIEIHRELGPGLLESAYEAIIADELAARGHEVQRQRVVPIHFKGRVYDRGYRLDLLVDELVVVEIKSAERHLPLFEQQVLTYLRGLGLRHGMVVNLGLPRAIDGINRVTNYRAPAPEDRANGRHNRHNRDSQDKGNNQQLAEQAEPTKPADLSKQKPTWP